ncbi:helix-turn-helix transcriptional regulator [Rhodococcus fascians]|nr:helix-turn-helix transcriptional regulator [Rhodococcus fascians]MBY3841949.1 helix-turn-helix transcriptional regulator [Rhodococcus fascians]MBY3844400.1 helix-turn-helix transcriptional regulator [Rhodococcus fascians]MBY3850346.1 helix-turn-helix transcriptional regulator [Rhodococcus fascians]MBY3854605.1 helix-turn-helix transcriptional regulator [Rhodococcus fascians]
MQVVHERGGSMTAHEGSAIEGLDLGVILRALADENRRAVIAELAADSDDPERTCNSFGLPVSKQTQTHHFRTLSDAGLIDYVDYGNRKGISLRRAEIDQRFPGLLRLLVVESEPAEAANESRGTDAVI